MQKPWTYMIVRLLFLVFVAAAICAAKTPTVVVGVNVCDEYFVPQATQDIEIKYLEKNGVKTVRTGLNPNTIYFITQAYQHGIGCVVILYPDSGSKVKLRWRGSRAEAPLSQVNPQSFAEWLKPLFDKLEAAGVHLTAFELGNEINTSEFNGDLLTPGSGRVLAVSDLNNPNDPEAPIIVAGYKKYLQIAAVVKDLRDHSKLNQTTPIVSAGMAEWGRPGPRSWNGELGVGAPDAIEFLRQNGIDKLVDGYGVHVYPNADPHDPIPHRMKHLDRMFAACRQDTKPCWLTEWGFSNASQSCPVDDKTRVQLIKAERTAFQKYVKEGRLAATIFYNWTGNPGPWTEKTVGLKADPPSIFRCCALTEAGKLALSPM